MPGTPHDALFKWTFSDPARAREELASVLPAALTLAIDWSTLSLRSPQHQDDGLGQSESDLVFAVEARGVPLRLVLLFEHQSSVDRRMPLRLLQYMVRIWEREELPLPPVVAVVLHHSGSGWNAATSFDALFELGLLDGTGIEALLPRFRFVLDDLSAQTDEALAARIGDAYVRLVLAALREARRARSGADLVQTLGALLREVVASSTAPEAYLRILRYVFLVAARGDREPFFRALRRELGATIEERAMSLWDVAVEEGIEKGIEKGIAQARRATLERLLVRRFGPLSEELRASFARLPDEALEAALDRVLDAARPEDVVGEAQPSS
jgi:predicted transposase YdaD